jgi:hypothetical protein
MDEFLTLNPHQTWISPPWSAAFNDTDFQTATSGEWPDAMILCSFDSETRGSHNPTSDHWRKLRRRYPNPSWVKFFQWPAPRLSQWQ